MLKIRRSLIFTIGIPYLGKTVFILKQGPGLNDTYIISYSLTNANTENFHKWVMKSNEHIAKHHKDMGGLSKTAFENYLFPVNQPKLYE